MGDDAIMREPKKSGCLKWTCGCLACFLVVGVVAGILAWRWLGSWDSGKSAWEHLPPETLWALEIHDTKAIFDAALADPGLETLMQHLLRDVAENMGDEIELPTRLSGNPGRELAELRKSLGPYFRILIPNTVIAGSVTLDESGLFFICMPPAFLRWAVEMPSVDMQIEESRSGSTRFFYSAIEGWLVVALDQHTVQVVLDGWHAAAKPLGPTMGRADPYLFMAARQEGERGVAAETEEPGEAVPGHFTLADPFAAASAGKPARDEAFVGKPLGRLAVFPTEIGWSVWGDVEDEKGAPGLAPVVTAVDKMLGADTPSLSVADLSDCEFSLRVAPEVFAELKSRLAKDTSVSPETGHPNRVLLSRWLNEAWLGNAAGDFSFVASAPDATASTEPPPMPHLALGWTIRDGVPPVRAGEEFTNALTLWLDSVTAPGGSPLLQSLKGNISYSANRHGNTPAGEIELPVIALNGAKPAWRFNTEEGKAMGWIASDPKAIPTAKRQETLFLPTLPQPGRDRYQLTGAWHFSKDFTGALFALLRDKLPPLVDDDGGMGEERALFCLAAAERIITAFPRGGLRMEYDAKRRCAAYKFLVPKGERNPAK